MKRAVIIVAIILLVLVVAGALFLLLRPNAEPVPGTPIDPFGFGSGTRDPQDSLSVTLADGSVTSVPDFTKENQPAWASATNGYQVGGSDEGAYHIVYFPDDSGFLISLLTEPLGANRLNAEDEIRAKLQLPEAELCKLNVRVATSIHVNETYAGQNLGLSFCPGAVRLP